MTYKEYLRFSRKLRKVKAVLHTVAIAASLAGFCIFMLAAGCADGATLSGFMDLAAVGIGLLAIGAGAEAAAR